MERILQYLNQDANSGYTQNTEFKVIADSVNDIIAQFDRSYRHLFVNKVIEGITGRTRAEFIGKTNSELGMPEDLVKLWNQQLEDVFTSGKEVEIDFSYTSADQVKHFHSFAYPLIGNLGNVDTVLVINRDVTSQKRLTEKLLQTTKFSSMSHLTAEIAHHINNPLTIISSRCEMLKSKLEKQGPSTTLVNADIEKITAATQRLKKLVHSMVALNQYDLAPDEKINLNIQDAIYLALSICDERQFSKGIRREIRGSLNAEFPILTSGFIDSLSHVLKNAFEAANQSNDPWVRIELSKNSNFYSIRIIDSGTPKKIQEDDVLPFATSKGPLATGLGLSIVKSQLNHMGASLKFPDHQLNTTVEILIPILIKLENTGS